MKERDRGRNIRFGNPGISRLSLLLLFVLIALLFIIGFHLPVNIPLKAAKGSYTNPLRYQNGEPIRMADPAVMKYEDTYFLYATSAPDYGYYVWTSEDLVTWESGGYALIKHIQDIGFGENSFWAPEVVYYKERFYMLYSARDTDGRLKLALAASDHPTGPFMNIKAPLFDDGVYAYIDGQIFIDDDGEPYLFFVRDCSKNRKNGLNISEIYIQKMSEDLMDLEGEAILAVSPDQDWELKSNTFNHPFLWNEGPSVIKYRGKYYMTYSANLWATEFYATGCAVADNPMGPWKKYPDPILTADREAGAFGPGHNSFALSPDGSELFIVYHTLEGNQGSHERVLNIDRAYFDDEGVLKISGPTRRPQPAPSRFDTKGEIEGLHLSSVWPRRQGD